MRVLCTVAFCLFTFFYLMFYQADVMVVAQHIASGGQTHYVPWMGGILITLVLKLLQIGVNALFGLYKRLHALTYLPSLLVLAFITNISPHVYDKIDLGAWVWIFPLVLAVFSLLAFFSRKLQAIEPEVRYNGPSSQLNWINLSILFLLMVGVGLIGNGNKVFHLRAAVERKIMKGDFSGALEIGKNCDKTDASLTMLRAYSLAKERQLPERLFHYALTPGAASLTPNGKDVYALMLVPQSVITNKVKTNRHYQLCGLLMDKNLKEFSKVLSLYYAPDSVLPTHYAEAMALCRTSASVSNSGRHEQDSVMSVRYLRFMNQMKKAGCQPLLQKSFRQQFGNTYWYYYYVRSRKNSV